MALSKEEVKKLVEKEKDYQEELKRRLKDIVNKRRDKTK